MSSALTGKLETDTEIKASADKFHDLLCNRPHHVRNACSEKIPGCELHGGDWGTQGSIICWSYMHDGEAKIAKDLVEAVDSENNSITFRVIEGNLLKEYKSFVRKVQATPKGEGSIVHLTLEYEKLHQGIPDPESLLQFLVHVIKDMGNHLG